MSATFTYAYLSSLGGVRSTTDSSWSIRSRTAVILERRCADRRGPRTLGAGTCEARFAGRRRPAWAVDDHAFRAGARAGWGSLASSSFVAPHDGTFRGRPISCKEQRGGEAMTAPQVDEGPDTLVLAESALIGARFEIGTPTTVGTVAGRQDPHSCTSTDDGSVQSSVADRWTARADVVFTPCPRGGRTPRGCG